MWDEYNCPNEQYRKNRNDNINDNIKVENLQMISFKIKPALFH